YDSLPSEIWTIIVSNCNTVQLHCLYCSCRRLHDIVDSFLRPIMRKRCNKKVYNADCDTCGANDEFDNKIFSDYLVEHLSVPGLLFFRPKLTSCESIAIDLFSDLTPSLIEWYG